MFEAMRLIFIYAETPIHAGSGQGFGAIDLPIQRERTTHYPMIQASTLKGRLRAEAAEKCNSVLTREELWAIFGPETDKASEHAGALSVGDARILLFPVRSLSGIFAWTSSVNVLARFVRDAVMAGLLDDWEIPPEPGKDEVWVAGGALVAGESVVLEEFSFRPRYEHAGTLKKIGEWLAKNALLQADEYKYWCEALPQKLCVLPTDDFRDFVVYSTEIQSHIRLDPHKKTVQKGALWTTESLPMDSLLYSPLMATRSRAVRPALSGTEILDKLAALELNRTRLGGDETTGQGMVALRIVGGEGK